MIKYMYLSVYPPPPPPPDLWIYKQVWPPPTPHPLSFLDDQCIFFWLEEKIEYVMICTSLSWQTDQLFDVIFLV